MTTTTTQKIPAGYKQTEIGVIPIDWDVKKLGDCCRKITDGTHDTPKPIDNGIPFLTAIHVKESLIDFDNCYFLPQNIHETIYRRCNPEKGDVLMVNIGAGVATTALVYVDYEFSLKNVALLKPDNSSLIGSYLNYYQTLSKPRITTSISSGGAQPFLSLRQISGLLIALPSKAEQTAIATVLADTDALIGKLELLIEKKKNIKQGAMQELLTGKRRLPGFSGKWERKKLGEIGEITGSGVDKKSRSDEIPVRLLNFLDVFHKNFISSKDLNHQVTARPDQLVRCSVKQGDVFFTPSSEMPFDIGISAIATEDISDAVYSYHISRLRLKEDWDLLFRAYIFQTKDFSNQTTTNCEGSGKRYVLNLTTFRERLTVYYPIDNKEQAAIAKILFDMDTEIKKLESQLIKYQNIKQGMMQTLITGKIRLI